MRKLKERTVSMKKDENYYRIIYAKWVFEECSCPIDEIEFLFDNLPKEHKKQIINDMKNLEDEGN